jgi:proteasome lid subunit RPN8/RPN11
MEYYPDLIVPVAVKKQTDAYLQVSKKNGIEVVLLWSATPNTNPLEVKMVWFPRQMSGEAFFQVPEEQLFEINKELSKIGQVLVAQVHSHPSAAFHSSTDDEFAIANHAGAYSIVVPDYGGVSVCDYARSAYFVKESQKWRQLTASESREKIRFGD